MAVAVGAEGDAITKGINMFSFYCWVLGIILVIVLVMFDKPKLGRNFIGRNKTANPVAVATRNAHGQKEKIRMSIIACSDQKKKRLRNVQ